VPCVGRYARSLGAHTLLVTVETYASIPDFGAALRGFEPALE
jgi:hypothetical protein